AAELPPERFEILVTLEAGKLSCEVEVKLSVEKCEPGFNVLKSKRCAPFSCCSSCRSLSLSGGGPKWPESFEDELWKLIGRVTDMSVPTPASGSRTLACASSSPRASAFTVTTRPTPIP